MKGRSDTTLIANIHVGDKGLTPVLLLPMIKSIKSPVLARMAEVTEGTQFRNQR